MKSSVLAMCQIGMHILLALKNGTLIAVSTSSYQKEYQVIEPQLAKDDLAQMLTYNDQVTILAYKDGTVALVSCLNFEELRDVKEQTVEDNMNSVVIKSKYVKISVFKITSFLLHAMEVCKPENDHQMEDSL